MVPSGKRSGETTRTHQEEIETRDSNEATGTAADQGRDQDPEPLREDVHPEERTEIAREDEIETETSTDNAAEDFKGVVAMTIGRKPHETLLKRQGERPFKDQLTLQDYGVSNSVQLDLEVDTGD
ncbi:uncharacterized protein Z519_05834 [Cladophialophora bantiana CBS 173.52]|uniref:Ubiquitin-like modifier HUB1 n=1 Tax=Cladophialophora bantiana (strain ATCC 10958 / CBS 173.52 / CDC B-1940 / NIH 8579) TaxID=1442370 RepID=A0A0D2I8W5_CLAB1|nr:uncharacterized protein Z519_05834 [Cladophialophora bantiana CBS 173.52]KIW93229.1 hypothetical protein Z519_05834 [Cladophialophora bantiana CBS 173.52]